MLLQVCLILYLLLGYVLIRYQSQLPLSRGLKLALVVLYLGLLLALLYLVLFAYFWGANS